MEEGKKRVIPPATITTTSTPTKTTTNAATGSKQQHLNKRLYNYAPIGLKQKYSKNSPIKQSVTLAQPSSMLRAHKQVSTTSFDDA